MVLMIADRDGPFPEITLVSRRHEKEGAGGKPNALGGKSKARVHANMFGLKRILFAGRMNNIWARA